jgi:hypothetical protein
VSWEGVPQWAAGYGYGYGYGRVNHGHTVLVAALAALMGYAVDEFRYLGDIAIEQLD